ncbi:hypothetical protein EDB81DRAFT_913593 [Dactylonectria macrodidyma]|uniref:Uncharacterized protein n=1 Tax=Dactylonectria macrodidyma TaxID=307937 RepID=A0A9P9IIJ4_9HYPO|nr:hypothetical protein EDB81DRAFT_913593 [Dactylonectria macrodidyma]
MTHLIPKEDLSRWPLPRHEILHYIRTWQESEHLDHHWGLSFHMYQPCTRPFDPEAQSRHDACHNGSRPQDNVSGMSLQAANRLCNITMPLYLAVLRATLNRWLYRKWFRPYKGDIENGQFIARVMQPRHIPEDTDFNGLTKLLISLNAAICGQVDKLHRETNEFLRTSEPDPVESTKRLRDFLGGPKVYE